MAAKLTLGIIADDPTGASDAAGMLTERGVRTLLFMGLPSRQRLLAAIETYPAIVLGLGTRSLPPQEAYRQTLAAVNLLKEAKPKKIQLKYGSTFDSTPQGNIGPSLDAVLDGLNLPATIVAPALPANGRTTYLGYHFVHGHLLSESPLKDHPLNPMTDAHLGRWLQRQTQRKVSSVPWSTIREGAEKLKLDLDSRARQGERYLITDALEQSDLKTIALATSDWPLLSGGSGITAEMPDLLFPEKSPLSFEWQLCSAGTRTLAIAGSCAPTTRGQNSFALENGFSGIRLTGVDILDGKIDPDEVCARAAAELKSGRNVLLFSSAEPKEAEDVQQQGRSQGRTVAETGTLIGSLLAEIGSRLVEGMHAGRLVISGGETSSAVCKRLAIAALEVGLPLEPGVPYCFPFEIPGLVLVLKSGNFGSQDFYTRVANRLEHNGEAIKNVPTGAE